MCACSFVIVCLCGGTRVVAVDSTVRGNVCYHRVGRGLELLACRLRQRFCSFHSQRCPPDTRAPRRQYTSNPAAGASPRPTDKPICIVENRRAGVETRPYNGAPSRRPLRSHCHSEPLGEESRFELDLLFAIGDPSLRSG